MKNILMIVVDDLRPELACYGASGVKTPNIDRLAKRSALFERAYCNYPQCMPSRASMMSGVRPRKFCLWSNELTTKGEPTLPAALRSAGMATVSIGKVYHEPLDDAFNWTELHMDTFRYNGCGAMGQWFQDYQQPENQQRRDHKAKLAWNQCRPENDQLPPLCECADAPDENYVDYKIASKAIERMRAYNKGGRSLFLAVGFYRPHLPWVAPKKYWDLYDRDSIEIASNPFFPADGVGKGDLGDARHYFDAEVGDKFSDIGRYEDDDFPVLTEAKQRELIHGYRASVSFMDAQVGRLLDELESSGTAEETIIVLLGDNGYHLGEHKLWSKSTTFDEATRVPLMISVPGITSGEKIRELVELVDIYPTLCSLNGIALPAHLEGRQLPLSESDRGKGAAFSVYGGSKSIITDLFRLTHYGLVGQPPHSVIAGRGDCDLFDHTVDREENRNVVNDPKYSQVVLELKHRLNQEFA